MSGRTGAESDEGVEDDVVVVVVAVVIITFGLHVER
jgi:hypothetical protein